MGAVGGGHDRLSELPDDLLRRILHFVPLKEAASTTALSRRWRAPLWLSSGAVNLRTGRNKAHFFPRRHDFVSAATRVLDAADAPISRLTWYVGDCDKARSHYKAFADAVLSHRAARRVEELLLVVDDPYLYKRKGIYTVSLDSLPLETLRVLELTDSKGLLYTSEAVLPRLSSLRLTHGTQHISSLQRVIDAAPALAAIRLESVLIDATNEEARQATTTCRLRCPATTVLVLDSCTWEERRQCSDCYYPYTKNVHVDRVEIDAPRLRRFSNKGLLRSFSFSTQPLELDQVDLDFSGRQLDDDKKDKDPERELETFWRFARSFTSTKEMRLRVTHLEDIAVLNEARRIELLPTFRRLKRLEVQGVNLTKGKTPAMAIVNLLRCCPKIASLLINLTAEHRDHASNKEGVPTQTSSQKEIQIAALLGPRHHFKCLQSSLTRVGLKFQLEKSDCLGDKLIKFFAENAMVLKEMHIDCGDEKFCENLNPKTEKWNSKRRKLGATSFVVLPLNS